jgi:hypothetical protein
MTRSLTALALILSLGSVAHAGSPSPLAIAIGEGPAQTVQSGVEKGYDRLRFAEEPTNRTDTRVMDRSDRSDNSDSSSRTSTVTKTYAPTSTRESGTATTGPIQVNPVINLTLQNNSPVSVQNNSVNQAQNNNEVYAGGVVPVAVPVGVAVPVATPRPVCRPAVIGNLGIDPYGRPVFINIRMGGSTAYPNVVGPNGLPVILPPGTRVSVCDQAGNWLLVDVCSATACIRGWAYNRYVLGL